MNGPDGKDNCSKFVDILGLRTIFPLFMKTPTKNRKKMLTAEEHEGMISIFINVNKENSNFNYYICSDIINNQFCRTRDFNHSKHVEELQRTTTSKIT